MNVDEAILTRRSVRAFKKDPVPLELVKEILEVASRAPSGTNIQPWKLHVVAGEVRDRLERELLAHREQGQVPDLKAVDLSWAGRLSANHPSLTAIDRAKVGDPVRVANDGAAWLLTDQQGLVIGRMARSWSPPAGLQFLRGEVGAVITWRKSDNKEEFRDYIRRDEWEAILPELVFG